MLFSIFLSDFKQTLLHIWKCQLKWPVTGRPDGQCCDHVLPTLPPAGVTHHRCPPFASLVSVRQLKWVMKCRSYWRPGWLLIGYAFCVMNVVSLVSFKFSHEKCYRANMIHFGETSRPLPAFVFGGRVYIRSMRSTALCCDINLSSKIACIQISIHQFLLPRLAL